MDPKLAWALRNKHFFPIDLNIAPKEMLLRIPGLGIRNVERILSARVMRKIRYVDLVKMRLNMAKVKFFVITHDNHSDVRLLDSPLLKTLLTEKESVQLDLFDAVSGSMTGEV
jgi:predicted DNA-binding helix-hairpin-helix protein